MLQLKGCPRCQGALKTNRDMYGEYKECLQCGYMLDIEKPDGLYSMARTEMALLTKNNKVKAA